MASDLKIDEDDGCPVCRGLAYPTVVLKCNHVMCEGCMKGMVDMSRLDCPNCRTRLNSWLRRRKNDFVDAKRTAAVRNKYPAICEQLERGQEVEVIWIEVKPHHIQARQGELKDEFDRSMREQIAMRTAEEEAQSIELLKQLQAEEAQARRALEERRRQEEKDFALARRLSNGHSADNTSLPRPISATGMLSKPTPVDDEVLEVKDSPVATSKRKSQLARRSASKRKLQGSKASSASEASKDVKEIREYFVIDSDSPDKAKPGSSRKTTTETARTAQTTQAPSTALPAQPEPTNIADITAASSDPVQRPIAAASSEVLAAKDKPIVSSSKEASTNGQVSAANHLMPQAHDKTCQHAPDGADSHSPADATMWQLDGSNLTGTIAPECTGIQAFNPKTQLESGCQRTDEPPQPTGKLGSTPADKDSNSTSISKDSRMSASKDTACMPAPHRAVQGSQSPPQTVSMQNALTDTPVTDPDMAMRSVQRPLALAHSSLDPSDAAPLQSTLQPSATELVCDTTAKTVPSKSSYPVEKDRDQAATTAPLLQPAKPTGSERLNEPASKRPKKPVHAQPTSQPSTKASPGSGTELHHRTEQRATEQAPKPLHRQSANSVAPKLHRPPSQTLVKPSNQPAVPPSSTSKYQPSVHDLMTKQAKRRIAKIACPICNLMVVASRIDEHAWTCEPKSLRPKRSKRIDDA